MYGWDWICLFDEIDLMKEVRKKIGLRENYLSLKDATLYPAASTLDLGLRLDQKLVRQSYQYFFLMISANILTLLFFMRVSYPR